MANHESSLFNLELIKQRTLSEDQTYVLNVFSHGLESTTLEAAMETAYELDFACPPPQNEEETQDYLWMTWDIMVDIAMSPDVTSEIQMRLVYILELLRQFAKGNVDVYGSELRLWRDLPMLSINIEAWFNDPIEIGEFNPKSAQKWWNLNSFGARCLGAGVLGLYAQAMRASRAALEEDLSTVGDISMRECRIQVACEWIFHSAKPLLRWAQENAGYLTVPVEDDAAYIKGGTLYYGPSCMCLQRWCFWIARFEELTKEDSGLNETTQITMLETLQSMKMGGSSIFSIVLE